MIDLDLDLDLNMGDFGLEIGDGVDLGAFDTSDDIDLSNRYLMPKMPKRVKHRSVSYDRAVDLVNDCKDQIMAGETVHCLLSGNFIFGDFFEAFAVETNSLIDELIISTLSLGQDNVDSLKNLLKGDYVQSLGLIVSDYFWSHNRHNAPYIFKSLDIDDKFQFAVSGTHTKIALIKIGNQKIVVSGSANLRSSRCVEEMTIQTSSDLYDFHAEWHNLILQKYGVINKAVRAKALFDLITKNCIKEQEWLVE